MRKIEAIKRELYENIRSQVSDRLGTQDAEIKQAEKSFNRFFSLDWKKISTSVLQKKIDTSDVIFWGDFHGVRQFQKNLVRWLKVQNLQSCPLILVLECLPSSHQKWVDQYLKSLISEEEFLKKTKWEKNWGFPWGHYKPLFDWARENKQKLLVANHPKTKRTSVQREKWCLQIILRAVEENPKSKVFTLYGEYHLLPGGFPRLIKKKKLRSAFVFQNADKLYFQKSFKDQKREGEVYQHKGDFYCIQSVSPWVKWQNYNLFLESSQEIEFEEDLDLTEHVLGLSKILSKTLDLPFDPNRCAVFTSQDRALWEHLKKIKNEHIHLFENLIHEGLSFAYHEGGWAYLGRVSANEAAGLAMQDLLFQFNKKLEWKGDSDQFWEFLIWVRAFSYFGSKIINPHRKSPDLLELQKKSRGFSGRPVERQAARLAVNYTLHQALGKDSIFKSLSVSDPVRFQAVKWISSLLGEKIYNAYNQGALSLMTLKSFMLKNPFEKNFHVVVHDLYEAIENN